MSNSHPFASGMPLEYDGVALTPPAGDSRYGENHAFWIHDEATGVQINAHINTREDLGAYAQRVGKMSIIFPDGRLLLLREHGANSQPGSPASAGLRARCIEPFCRWTLEFNGVMQDATIARNYMTANALDFPLVSVSIAVELEMVAPAWRQGSLVEGGLGPVTALIGGERYEQLYRNRGTLHIGSQKISLSGYGNRTHRWGARDLGASAQAPRMLGHVWAAAYLPNGFGFGLQSYPTANGGVLWSEAHVLRDGRLDPAQIVQAPWLQNYWERGERFAIRLKTRDEVTHEIRGETIGTAASLMLPGPTPGDYIPLMQAYARYEVDGQSAINMLERSLRRSCIETGVGRP
ncbi:MAG: hypothetical protein ABW110_02315 [Steroidobacteraceae bacterium]